jgi:hypothetical protein
MHFWNKLSTAALMRLTILASLNLLLTRLVDGWEILLHPWFFFPVVTLNLGLYAIMVYAGILNTRLIGMMLGGLAATLATIACVGMDATAFMFGGPFAQIGELILTHLNQMSSGWLLELLPLRSAPGGRLRVGQDQLALIGYLVVDLLGVVAILLGGWLGRRRPPPGSRADVTTRPSP